MDRGAGYQGMDRQAHSSIALLVAPRPLLPEEAESNQAPLMLVGPDRTSIYVRSSSIATTGQRFNFGTHGTAVLPSNEPAQSWLAPRLGELAKEVCAGGTAALMIIGGAGSGKRAVLLGAEGSASEGALYAAVSALRASGQRRLQLSWRALVAEVTVDMLGAAGVGGQGARATATRASPAAAVCLPVDTAEQLREATRVARDAARLACGRPALQLLWLSSAEPRGPAELGQVRSAVLAETLSHRVTASITHGHRPVAVVPSCYCSWSTRRVRRRCQGRSRSRSRRKRPRWGRCAWRRARRRHKRRRARYCWPSCACSCA